MREFWQTKVTFIALGRYWRLAQSELVRQRIGHWTTAERPWALCLAAGHQLLDLDSAASYMLQLLAGSMLACSSSHSRGVEECLGRGFLLHPGAAPGWMREAYSSPPLFWQRTRNAHYQSINLFWQRTLPTNQPHVSRLFSEPQTKQAS